MTLVLPKAIATALDCEKRSTKTNGTLPAGTLAKDCERRAPVISHLLLTTQNNFLGVPNVVPGHASTQFETLWRSILFRNAQHVCGNTLFFRELRVLAKLRMGAGVLCGNNPENGRENDCPSDVQLAPAYRRVSFFATKMLLNARCRIVTA